MRAGHAENEGWVSTVDELLEAQHYEHQDEEQQQQQQQQGRSADTAVLSGLPLKRERSESPPKPSSSESVPGLGSRSGGAERGATTVQVSLELQDSQDGVIRHRRVVRRSTGGPSGGDEMALKRRVVESSSAPTDPSRSSSGSGELVERVAGSRPPPPPPPPSDSSDSSVTQGGSGTSAGSSKDSGHSGQTLRLRRPGPST